MMTMMMMMMMMMMMTDDDDDDDDDVLEKKGCGAGGCTPGINELPLLVQIFIKYYGRRNYHGHCYDTIEK